MHPYSKTSLPELKKDLELLDQVLIDVNGKQMKPSQCYHLETDPAHLLFNTNCPQTLRSKIESILSKYSDANEDRSQTN